MTEHGETTRSLLVGHLESAAVYTGGKRMRTNQFTVWKCGRLALASMALFGLIACGGAETPSPDAEMEAETKK